MFGVRGEWEVIWVQHERGESVGPTAQTCVLGGVNLRAGKGILASEFRLYDLIRFVEDGLPLFIYPAVRPVADLIRAPTHAPVPPSKACGQRGARYQPYPCVVEHDHEFVHGGIGGEGEILREGLGDSGRGEPAFGRNAPAESVQCRAHSKFLPVSFSYISTMNRLTSMVIGPTGLVPKLKRGSVTT